MEVYEENAVKNKLWKKVLCVILSIIIAFGALITLTVGSSGLQDLLGIQSMLSAYAKEYVDTDGAIALNSDEMLADHNIIDLENRDGSNTVYLFSEPITFTDEDGDIKAKDISVEIQNDKELKSQGYEFTNGQNDYRINFSKSSDKGLFIECGEASYSLIPQSGYSVTGAENTSYILGELFEDFEYENIYGNGTNLKFYPQLNGVKDEIILNYNLGKNEFSFKIITENCSAVLNDDGTVSLISTEDDEEIQTFSAPYAYDSEYVDGYDNEHRVDCTYRLETVDDSSYLLTVTVPENWLDSDTTVYPITIDPSTSNLSNSADAGVSSLHMLTNYGNSSTGGFGKSLIYGYGRVYEKFELPSAIKPGAKISYAYHWVRETTQATDSTYVRPFLVKDEWKESSITWNNKPEYDDTVNTNWKNINGQSADRENYPNWYNYNLVNCVKKWVNGTANNGVVFVSGEEVDADQEYKWRSFASRTHENSAMRPYTVINYTNDTTAPTVTVNVDKTEFTKDSVKIFLTNGADTGGAGIHKEPFSFSTEKGKYYWGTAKEKSYSENCTVYVSIRDKADNIKTYTVNINNIDNEGPVISNVSLSTDDWTNQNVDVTVFSADVISGVKDYSFSTESGVYAWQTSNKKTFLENTTVYVSSRDNLGNVSEETVVKIDNIDKAKPAAPSVTGDNNGWVSANTVLTANSTDVGSGAAVYSFSSALNEFDWQNENSFTVSKDTVKLFVYAKDKAGNISEPQAVEYQFDESLPSGSVSAEIPSDWVRYVNITADASDEVSGLHEEPYSFSRSEGTYSWQKNNVYQATVSGTYYVYVRDSAGNITLLDTVTVDKIDSSAPVINNLDIRDENNKTIITVTANDSMSGIAEYSIDNGKTWQQSNIFEIEKDSINCAVVKVKDKLGNCSAAKYKELNIPDYYIQDGYLCLYNARPETGDTIYYRFAGARAWSKYSEPIKLDGADFVYLTYYNRITLNPPSANKVTLDYEPQSDADKFGYSETVTDLALKYKTVTFDISRSFDDGKWQYSYNSSAQFINSSLIKAVLPDFSEAYFVKENKYSYVDQLSNAKLMMIYDETDDNIIGCSIKTDTRSYGYDYNGTDFILSSVSDFYGSSFDFTRQNNSITIVDNSGRECIIECDNNTTTVADFNGGIITYNYSDNNLMSVTDQTGVVIDSYTYSNNKITKSGMMSVEYDSSGRVTKYLYDNGAYTAFEYGDNTVTTTNSKEEVSSYTYDSKDRVISTTDNLGDETAYEYDENERTVKISKDGEVLKTYKYNADDTLFSEQAKDKTATVYYYDEHKRVVTEITHETYTHYVYDDFGNLTMVAVVKDYYVENQYYHHREIQDYLDYYNITRYTYENGLLIKSYDEENDITVLYEYDDYGNIASQTTLTVEDDATKIVKTESRYDILGRLVWSKSNGSETEYTYDAAGRLLLTNTDNEYYQRTVYDNNGRIVQELDNDEYNPALDNLPNAYSDTSAGKTYVYNENGDLISEKNKYGITTEYAYSEKGNVCRKSFDIYDYYYTDGGKCSSVAVGGNTIIDYDYNIDNASVTDENAQFVNSITYADGYVEKQTTDKYGTLRYKFANDQPFYNVSLLSKGKSLAYKDLETWRHNTITVNDGYYSFNSSTVELQKIFDYSVKTGDDATTVNETHFNTPFTTEITENNIKYTTQANRFVERENIDVGFEPDDANQTEIQEPIYTVELVRELTDREFTYSVQKNEDKVTETITGDLNQSLNAEQYFNEESNTYYKTYENGLSYYNTYDEDGNIIGDENNSYAYNELGELISTSGLVNSSYQYDSRGNITSKTVNDVTTSYSYDNADWKDQLTSVNGIPLTYDSNGNLASYGDTTYTWSHGKQLASVTNENGTYNYTYDENGIRLTKPGYTFDTFNGRVLAQHGANNIYFQYNGDKPIGFILNQNQYYYLTNPSGDIVGITDSKCDLIATYTYDEWGKLLSIETAEENNAEQLKIAKTNPLRYRGYYYDNETGYYYLQSRYYDPELGRFISADDFSYINPDAPLNINAYSYCWNNPVALEDAEGTTPQISIDLTALQPLVDGASAVIKAGLNKFAENIKKLISKYNDFLDKLEFNINHPDVVINNTLSKIFGREILIKMPFLDTLRAYFGTFDIRKGELVGGIFDGYHIYDSDNEESGIAPYGYINPDEKTNNWFEVAVKVLTFGIEADFLSRLFEAFMQAFDPLFDFNTWYESLSVFFQDLFSDLITDGVSAMNTIFLYFFDQFAQDLTMTTVNFSIGKLIEKIPSKYASSLFDAFNLFKSIDENFEDYHLIEYSFILTFLDIGLFFITIFLPGLAIPSDMANDLIKNVFLNLDSGRLWG